MTSAIFAMYSSSVRMRRVACDSLRGAYSTADGLGPRLIAVHAHALALLVALRVTSLWAFCVAVRRRVGRLMVAESITTLRIHLRN
jgi:hypothetical protein